MMDELKASGTISIKSFYLRRFFRIIPVYWLYIAIIAFGSMVGILVLKGGSWSQALSVLVTLSFLTDIVYPGWFFGQTWSLSLEEQFYLLFPAFFWLICRGRLKAVSCFLVLIYMASIWEPQILAVLQRVFDRLFQWPVFKGFTIELDYDRMLSYRYIVAGVFLAINWSWINASLARGFYLTWGLILTLLLWPFLFQCAWLSWIPNQFVSMGHGVALAFLIGIIIKKPAPFAALRWRIAQALGALSYSLYLWQQLFTGPADHFKVFQSHTVIALPLLLLFAFLSYKFVEQPFIALGKRLMPTPQRQKSELSTSVS